MAFRFLATAALLASAVVAKTDIGGCTSFDDVYTPAHGYPYATRIWYVPDTGELCEILDCGGGRAPPKTTVPGCAAYKGTETYSPRFINPATLGKSPLGPSTTLAVSAKTTDASSEATSTSISATVRVDSSSITAHLTTSAATLSESASASASVTDSASSSAATPASSGSGSSSGAESASGSSTPSSSAAGAASSSSVPAAAATPAVAVLGSCLMAGAAACLAML